MSIRTATLQRNNALVEERLPLPELETTQVLVEVANASLNPTNVLALDEDTFGNGTVLGCDFASVVEKVEDKIAALIWGGEIGGLGAYSRSIAFKIPPMLDYASASMVPLAANTAWLALFSKDCLNISRKADSGISLLVRGGSSTVCTYTIQIAAMHGLNVVTTCSPHNFDAVKKSGAKHVFDYKDPGVVPKIVEATPDLEYAFDCIGGFTSSTLSGQAMNRKKGAICTVRPTKVLTENVPENVTLTDVLVFTAFLKPHVYKKIYDWPTEHDDHALSPEMYEKYIYIYINFGFWIQKGQLVPEKPQVMDELSVKNLEEAMDLNRSGKVSNEKPCIRVNTI